MESIIVTITNLSKSCFYDLEIPVEIPFIRLKEDICEVLDSYEQGLFLEASSIELFCNRLGRQLQSDETVQSAGIWNGDYITMLEV